MSRHGPHFVLRSLAIAAALCLPACSAEVRTSTSTPSDATASANLRLPESVAPTAYQLELTVDPSQKRFKGQATIDIELERSQDVIWMHGQNFTVDAAEVRQNGRTVAATFEQVEDDGLAKLTLSKPLDPGAATIAITYSAPFADSLEGLYRVDADGHAYAFTQFESTAARLAFPSFDEPRFKVPIALTLVVREDDVATASMPVVTETATGDGWKRVEFAPTPPLPTYLLAIAVGPFDVVDGGMIPPNEVRDTPIPLRGLAAHGKGQHLQLALKETPQYIAALERYTQTPLAYPKLDLLAVPNFEAGAMENVGLITFREYLLLVDENASSDTHRDATSTLAHELGHQWFGNLVTMPWWNDVWLNESFASWTEEWLVRAVVPDLPMDRWAFGRTDQAMQLDELPSTRRIREPVTTTGDIVNAFDSITYLKGSAVLTMFEDYVGHDRFRDVIRHYLTAHAHGHATMDDFLGAMDHVLQDDTSAAFATFVTQPGIPNLELELACDDSAQLHVKQSRYAPLGAEVEGASRWSVPFCWQMPSSTEDKPSCELITEPEQIIDLGDTCPAWFMPNANGLGYYRWSLDEAATANLLAHASDLDDTQATVVLSSLNAAYAGGTTSVRSVLEALSAFSDRDAEPIRDLERALLNTVRSRIVDADLAPTVEQFARDLNASRAQRLGLITSPKDLGGPHETTRVSLTAELARLGEPKPEAMLAKMGADAVGAHGAKPTPPWLRSLWVPAVVLALDEGGQPVLDAIIARLQQTPPIDAEERRALISALGFVRNPEMVTKVFDLALTDTIHGEELVFVLRPLLDAPDHFELLWEPLQANFDQLAARLPVGFRAFLPALAAGLCSEDALERAQTFFGPRVESFPGADRILQQTLESIQQCTARRAAHREAANAFFRTYAETHKS